MKFEGVEDGRVAMRTAELSDGTRMVTIKAVNLLPEDAAPADAVLELHWGCVKEGGGDEWTPPPGGSTLPPGTRDPDGEGIASRSTFNADGTMVREPWTGPPGGKTDEEIIPSIWHEQLRAWHSPSHGKC